jgi:threonylcarbamoyladenosine tRNA methylthiotransferase MtaB
MPLKASFHTLGCRLNQAETAIIAKGFVEKGFDQVDFARAADLAVINTCTVTENSDAKCRHAIRKVQRLNPQAFIAVIGCYSQMAAAEIAAIDGVDMVVGNQEKMRLAELISDLNKSPEAKIIVSTITRDAFTLPDAGQAKRKTRANLKIQDGCDFMCTFCIIPFARGRSRPRDWDNLRREAENLAASGFKEVVLTGVNIGTFQLAEKNIVTVVDMLSELAGIERVRISSIEPTTIPAPLLERMADNNHKLLPFLHIPLQSADNDILRAMRRLYTIQEWIAFVETAVRRVPDLCLGSDVMVGFPGETKEKFAAVKQRLADLPLAYFHVFSFSERRGTAAVKLPGKVSAVERQRRSASLRQLSERKRRAYNRGFLGRQLPVLFEEKKGDYWRGYTENYIDVWLRDEADLRNQVVDVIIEEVKDTAVIGALPGKTGYVNSSTGLLMDAV